MVRAPSAASRSTTLPTVRHPSRSPNSIPTPSPSPSPNPRPNPNPDTNPNPNPNPNPTPTPTPNQTRTNASGRILSSSPSRPSRRRRVARRPTSTQSVS
eukprot:scaffold99934_cov26-Phaeocystis_antarctica.AAC.1